MLVLRSFSNESQPTVTVQQQPAPTPIVKLEEPREKPEDDSNKNFRVVPAAFAGIDFRNHSYGPYRLASGKKIDLLLKDEKLDYDYPFSDRGWFSFNDIYYADVTGDGAPEAIAILWHVQCGAGSCDGGSAIFYIFAARKNRLQRIWHYESGSYGYGCGVKSCNVQNKQIVLETFGRCPKPATEYPGPGKFLVENETKLVFRFNGRRFVRSKLEFLPAPIRDVKNYQWEMQISL